MPLSSGRIPSAHLRIARAKRRETEQPIRQTPKCLYPARFAKPEALTEYRLTPLLEKPGIARAANSQVRRNQGHRSQALSQALRRFPTARVYSRGLCSAPGRIAVFAWNDQYWLGHRIGSPTTAGGQTKTKNNLSSLRK